MSGGGSRIDGADPMEPDGRRNRRNLGTGAIVLGALGTVGGIVVLVFGPHLNGIGFGLGGLGLVCAGLALRLSNTS